MGNACYFLFCFMSKLFFCSPLNICLILYLYFSWTYFFNPSSSFRVGRDFPCMDVFIKQQHWKSVPSQHVFWHSSRVVVSLTLLPFRASLYRIVHPLKIDITIICNWGLTFLLSKSSLKMFNYLFKNYFCYIVETMSFFFVNASLLFCDWHANFSKQLYYDSSHGCNSLCVCVCLFVWVYVCVCVCECVCVYVCMYILYDFEILFMFCKILFFSCSCI